MRQMPTIWSMPNLKIMNIQVITNVQDLKSEIYRLRHLDQEQQTALVSRFSSPSAVFSTALTLFSRSGHADSGAGHRDYVSLFSRYLIPLTLNKTIFRHSNFLVKLLVGLVSQQAAGQVTESAATNAFRKGKSILMKLFSKKRTYA